MTELLPAFSMMHFVSGLLFDISASSPTPPLKKTTDKYFEKHTELLSGPSSLRYIYSTSNSFNKILAQRKKPRKTEANLLKHSLNVFSFATRLYTSDLGNNGDEAIAGDKNSVSMTPSHRSTGARGLRAPLRTSFQNSLFQCWSTPQDLPSWQQIMRPCFYLNGSVRCRCSKNLVFDCSSNSALDPLLTFVPKVDEMILVQALNFSNNGLKLVRDDTFFSNVSGAQGPWLLDLYNNNMTGLPAGVFQNLSQLNTILIGGNRLSYGVLRQTVFSVPTLRKVDIKCGGLGLLPLDYFNNTAATSSLEELDFSWNAIKSLDMSVLKELKMLKSLTLWHNQMYSLSTAYLPVLTYVSLHKNSLSEFPQTCRQERSPQQSKQQDESSSLVSDSLFPMLKILDLNFNLITELSDPICLPSLQTLNLRYNRIQRYPRNMFSLQRFPVLKRLELNQMESEIRLIEPFAINNSGISYIAFALNLLDFSLPDISGDFFGGCNHVTLLELYNNDLSAVTVTKFNQLFEPLTALDTLDLRECQLGILTKDHLIYLQNVNSLRLEQNRLLSLPAGMFDGMVRLQNLSLTDNLITSVNSDTFNPLTQTRLKQLDLSGNPFNCGCDLLWFQQWLKAEPSLFQQSDRSRYLCNGLPNVTVQEYNIHMQGCLLSRLAANDIIIVVSIMITMILLFTLLYGYRWHLRLWLYEVCRNQYRRFHDNALDNQQQKQFRYDVFVSYAEEDIEWVNGELIPLLEGRWNLRACLHHRDFLPGRHIVDNIGSCVDGSRRLLMVLSSSFARSPWCQFELRFCQTCAMERDDVLVLLTLDECQSRLLTGAMLAVLRTTTYIEWEPRLPSARSAFWSRLRLALDDVIQARLPGPLAPGAV